MRKFLIFIVVGLSSVAALASVQPASAAQSCKQVCDQWAPDNNGKPRCFSAHTVCTKVSTVGSRGGGAPKMIQEQKNKYQN